MKIDLHQSITEDIIAAIEKGGILPWVRPWGSGGAGVPRNGVSRRPYSGINRIILMIQSMVKGYQSDDWFTFNSAKERGGWVRKGESHTKVVWYQIIKKKTASGEEETFPMMKYFAVFNRDQIEGLPPISEEPRSEINRNERLEGFLSDVGAKIYHEGDRAFYNMQKDIITLPVREIFSSSEGYYATALHELIHWTGHESRLKRLNLSKFGSPEYAQEELVAELGSAFLCAEFGVDGKTQHPEYIKSWLAALKGDKKYIFAASKAASSAVNFLTKTIEEGGSPD
jgi:antirestriction protein ArdC